MRNSAAIDTERVFDFFKEISAIPRGSGNMYEIGNYCMMFAEKHSLKAVRDDAGNVIIYKPAGKGYENSAPVILQGHLDMVCQKKEDFNIDFEKEGIDIYTDGDFIKARGTTLGADNGIAVAMILAILENDGLKHPPIEAVFTADEEIGMVGAGKLDFKNISGRRMINLDAEDPGVITVSCAGGSDFVMQFPVETEKVNGTRIMVCVKGLSGGHSGIEIGGGRVNANILMGRILNRAKGISDFRIININGGDKRNAIPTDCRAEIITDEPEKIIRELKAYADIVKNEILKRESGFEFEAQLSGEGYCDAMTSQLTERIIYTLVCVPNGVIEMSAEIENLVETSLNLGVLNADCNNITLEFLLRSNKKSALEFLEEKMKAFCATAGCRFKASGHYPPWEFKPDSKLQTIYKNMYKERFGKEPFTEAIHAGLECGIFAEHIADFDCISVGPRMYDIHTVNERLSISSVKETFELICDILEEL